MKVGVTFRSEPKVVRYESALRQVGIEPVRLPPDSQTKTDSLDGLVLTGGTDINPARYGQQRDRQTEDPDDARDELELRVLQEALASSIPVLAICRGMQLFNVAHGGTLIQHLRSAEVHSQKMPNAEPGQHRAAHLVQVTRNTRLASIVGVGEPAVNSRHHQAVDRVGEGFVVSAISSDGVIEALERPGEPFAVAVQWHPEDRLLASEADRKLFEAFARAASLRRPDVLQHG
ncbi:MAG TPA: gamma-glutamyl-gamma-aminobutyrate hydrolase family protein [Bryobacteraceae bacterium]|nr:gamma-glutamyl-gamma-aminobutyrate hydrolase family protein [Bryobacteraceae bacterium]